MRFARFALMVATLVVAIGCEGNVSTAPQTADVGSGAPAPPSPAPPGNPNQAKGERAAQIAAAPAADGAPEAAAQSPDAQPAADAPQPAGPGNSDDGTAEVAKAGVGAKGRDYQPGFVTTPIEQYFRTGERIAFEIQIPSAMKLYKAGHDNKGPKTHEEFMDVIIKENGVDLPDLPSGDEFVYDPKTEQLMVKHPVAKQP